MDSSPSAPTAKSYLKDDDNLLLASDPYYPSDGLTPSTRVVFEVQTEVGDPTRGSRVHAGVQDKTRQRTHNTVQQNRPNQPQLRHTRAHTHTMGVILLFHGIVLV